MPLSRKRSSSRLQDKIEKDKLDEVGVEHDGAKVLIAEIAAATPARSSRRQGQVLSEPITSRQEEEACLRACFHGARGRRRCRGARPVHQDMNSRWLRSSQRLPAPKARFTGHSSSRASRKRRPPRRLDDPPGPPRRGEAPGGVHDQRGVIDRPRTMGLFGSELRPLRVSTGILSEFSTDGPGFAPESPNAAPVGVGADLGPVDAQPATAGSAIAAIMALFMESSIDPASR